MIDAGPRRVVHRVTRRRRRRVHHRVHHRVVTHHVHHRPPSLLHLLGASWDLRISAGLFVVLVGAGVAGRRTLLRTPLKGGSAPIDAPVDGNARGAPAPGDERPLQRGLLTSIVLMVVATFVLPFNVVAVELHSGRSAPDSAIAGAFVATIWLAASLACGAVAVALPSLRVRRRAGDLEVAVLGIQLASFLAGLLGVALALQPLLTSGLHS
jgi:hypothetical protein